MGIFSLASPFDEAVESVTDVKTLNDDWGSILDICDRVSVQKNGPTDVLRSIYKRLANDDPHIVLRTVKLLDACIKNCGHEFRLQVASREFESEFTKAISRAGHPKVQQKLVSYLNKWAESEFKEDPRYDLIPSLVAKLRRQGFKTSRRHDSDDADDEISGGRRQGHAEVSRRQKELADQEDEDLKKAIAMSLSSSDSAKAKTSETYKSLYPSTDKPSSESTATTAEKKARALYDFEAVEDNELTLKAGELVIIIDDSDVNWWTGSNHRGQGMFPANFVSTEHAAVHGYTPQDSNATEGSKISLTNDLASSVQLKTTIDSDMMDKVIRLLSDADPMCTFDVQAEQPLLEMENLVVNDMGKLIDDQIETIDRQLAELTMVSADLVEALNLYNQFIKCEAVPSANVSTSTLATEYHDPVSMATADASSTTSTSPALSIAPGAPPPTPPHQPGLFMPAQYYQPSVDPNGVVNIPQYHYQVHPVVTQPPHYQGAYTNLTQARSNETNNET